MNEDNLVCDSCGEESNSLYKREKFIMMYSVEWICELCMDDLEKKELKHERTNSEASL